jgi:hypothetical protein
MPTPTLMAWYPIIKAGKKLKTILANIAFRNKKNMVATTEVYNKIVGYLTIE